ncbi:hypothetical protein BD311DRAFT_758322 [Dichomitus squalens]|uniref:Uncharacterized protein n=1 Tax=Dichomitus squalens TaxID=114155 RepID=A0A4Q9MLQ0_9APHY|nr:hypothetical protein BD311DRAFT_758322 [Dichomitus squalens]
MRSWRERKSCLPASPGKVVLCAILRVAFLNIWARLSYAVHCQSQCSGGCRNSQKMSDVPVRWNVMARCCAAHTVNTEE